MQWCWARILSRGRPKPKKYIMSHITILRVLNNHKNGLIDLFELMVYLKNAIKVNIWFFMIFLGEDKMNFLRDEGLLGHYGYIPNAISKKKFFLLLQMPEIIWIAEWKTKTYMLSMDICFISAKFRVRTTGFLYWKCSVRSCPVYAQFLEDGRFIWIKSILILLMRKNTRWCS